jgi:16S rRNA (guanine1207-N2)-methyltransferase
VSQPPTSCVYGAPSLDIVTVPEGAVQLSPLFPGAASLEDLAPESLADIVVAAPPGTVERRYVLALALRALAPGAPLIALGPKDKGGARIGKELEAFGCTVEETAKRGHRICHANRPDTLSGVDEAIAAGAPRLDPVQGLWTQPGVFSWDRPDPGSLLLISTMTGLAGTGVDLGCGIGLLSRAILTQPKVSALALVDVDRRAVETARRNVLDPRASFHWADARRAPTLEGLDFVVMNPPFHDAGTESKALGQAFIRRAHDVLRRSGTLWMVANRHLPYEAVLASQFTRVAPKADTAGFKVFEARK